MQGKKVALRRVFGKFVATNLLFLQVKQEKFKKYDVSEKKGLRVSAHNSRTPLTGDADTQTRGAKRATLETARQRDAD